MKLNQLFLFLVAASFTNLALAGGGSYDDSNTPAATPSIASTASTAVSTAQQNIKLSDNFKGFYITAKGGISKSRDAGVTSYSNLNGNPQISLNEDLGAGSAFGFSVGKYLTDSFRLELEATKRTDYEFDVLYSTGNNEDKANIKTEALFINGFYDFQPFTIRNTPITPYLGGGVGLSRNKMGTTRESNNGVANGYASDGNNINQFAYKLSAGALFSLTEKLSLDVNYQYVNLGEFKGSVAVFKDGVRTGSDSKKATNGGEIKTQELMVGLQYKF